LRCSGAAGEERPRLASGPLHAVNREKFAASLCLRRLTERQRQHSAHQRFQAAVAALRAAACSPRRRARRGASAAPPARSPTLSRAGRCWCWRSRRWASAAASTWSSYARGTTAPARCARPASQALASSSRALSSRCEKQVPRRASVGDSCAWQGRQRQQPGGAGALALLSTSAGHALAGAEQRSCAASSAQPGTRPPPPPPKACTSRPAPRVGESSGLAREPASIGLNREPARRPSRSGSKDRAARVRSSTSKEARTPLLRYPGARPSTGAAAPATAAPAQRAVEHELALGEAHSPRSLQPSPAAPAERPSTVIDDHGKRIEPCWPEGWGGERGEETPHGAG
jgi:hypothetical protein